MRKIGNVKRVKLLGIFVSVFMAVGCSAQDADISKGTPQDNMEIYSIKEETSSQPIEHADNNTSLTKPVVEQIIKEADKAIHTVMKKADIYQMKQPDEEEVRKYLLRYFDQGVLDYVLFVYQVKIEDGKCFYKPYSHYANFYMDTEQDMEIIEQGEGYCDISVAFVHNWRRKSDEEKVRVRMEKNETGSWRITGMSQWYNDFRYYYMPELDYLPEYLTRDMTEWMIQEFGTDENGEIAKISINTDENGFILQDSSVRELEKLEIESLSRYEMFLAIQEIYARNGKKFDDVMLYGYFHEKPWYEPYKQVFDENNLTEIERYNIGLLTAAGNLGEMAQSAYGNRYEEEEKKSGQPLSTEEAACIIGDAFSSLDKVFTSKVENKIEEKSDDVATYYSLGEYTTEQQLREYISTWFSEEAFDYLMGMCFVMHGVTKDEDGNYVLVRGLTLPMEQYVLDDFGSVVIKDYNDEECRVVVPFLNLENTSTGSEGEILLRWEKDRWVISEISEPHYDEYLAEWQSREAAWNRNTPLFEEFTEMDYCLFLETHLDYGVTLDYYRYGIYGDFVKTGQEGKNYG